MKNRETKKIDTQGLVKIIESSKKKKKYKIHVATKIFQSLRIFVNKEISELIFGLIECYKNFKAWRKNCSCNFSFFRR